MATQSTSKAEISVEITNLTSSISVEMEDYTDENIHGWTFPRTYVSDDAVHIAALRWIMRIRKEYDEKYRVDQEVKKRRHKEQFPNESPEIVPILDVKQPVLILHAVVNDGELIGKWKHGSGSMPDDKGPEGNTRGRKFSYQSPLYTTKYNMLIYAAVKEQLEALCEEHGRTVEEVASNLGLRPVDRKGREVPRPKTVEQRMAEFRGDDDDDGSTTPKA